MIKIDVERKGVLSMSHARDGNGHYIHDFCWDLDVPTAETRE